MSEFILELYSEEIPPNLQINARNDLQEKIKSFVNLASDTQMVYSAKFKFEPIVGETYHLYEGTKEPFLSLIEPNNWNKKHLGSFRLNGEYKWERLETT